LVALMSAVSTMPSSTVTNVPARDRFRSAPAPSQKLLKVRSTSPTLAHELPAPEVTGAGASFPAPLYSKWAADYNKATGVKINYQSVGSGAGIKQIDAKTVDFGASDMPLKDEELARKGQVQFPTVIGGVPVVNIKGIAPGQMKLTARCWVTSTWARSPSGTIRHQGAEPQRCPAGCCHRPGAPR
jgi:ABC-type phosphate transport system substrate-binding protein